MPSCVNKRLCDKDVRAIFECLRDPSKQPPLDLQIVTVGPNGLKLSPPSYEFDDGLYLLLKPRKQNTPPPSPPLHLEHLLQLHEPPEVCPWSLSGPQFPSSNEPGSLQQRYCYPKGRPAYSDLKGGALWTMRGNDGKEDTEYRLLHVYMSQKRAANKGIVSAPKKKARVFVSPSRTSVHRSNSHATLPTTSTCTSSPQQQLWEPYPLNDDLTAPELFPCNLEFMECDHDSLWKRLDQAQQSIRGWVVQAPPHQQASLVHAVVEWALRLSKDPLNARCNLEEDRPCTPLSYQRQQEQFEPYEYRQDEDAVSHNALEAYEL